MSISKKALDKIEHLYLLQFDLSNIAESDLKDATQRKEAKTKLKEFKALLKEADVDYMGGDDVYESLKALEAEVASKVK